MPATHINYMHPRCVREVVGDKVYCVSPGAQCYPELTKRSLPDYNKLTADQRAALTPRRT